MYDPVELLKEAAQTIEALADQQAMPDPFYELTLNRIRAYLVEINM